MATTIYYSNNSEYKEYNSKEGIKTAVKRYMEKNPSAVNVLSVIEGEQKEKYLKYNPWLNTERATYEGDIELVTPYKDGYVVARHFAVKYRVSINK